VGVYPTSGVPSAGTSEIQTITTSGTISGGTFTLSFEGFTTAAITWSSTNATLVANIDAALEALPNIGTGGVTTAVGTATAGVGTFTVTFAGNLAAKAVGLMTATSSLTGSGAAVAVTETTPGVDATFRGAPKGALAVNTATGVLYANTGTGGLAPTWTAQT
jgi:hypothetical protein